MAARIVTVIDEKMAFAAVFVDVCVSDLLLHTFPFAELKVLINKVSN